MQSGPTRRTVRPLSVRTAGRIRTYDRPFRQKGALSTELQRYAERKIDSVAEMKLSFFIAVDKSDTVSPPFVKRMH